MQKLNELVDQAKFVAGCHGSDWSSALCQDKDGNQSHEIICESRGEAVISTGSDSNESSWLCDYLELCSPENIIAIAEEFRSLEHRASNLNDGWLNAIAERDSAKTESAKWKEEAIKAHEESEILLAKLAELEKQEPIDFRWRWASDENAVWTYCHMDRLPDAVAAFGDNVTFELVYNRPAPAADLAKLVPDAKEIRKEAGGYAPVYSLQEQQLFIDGATWLSAAILRNIEEAK